SGHAVQESEFFTQDTQIPGLGVAPEAVDAAFAAQQGEVRGPVFTSRGPVFLTVTDTREPYIPELEQVRDRVREDLIDARAADLSRERAAQIAATLSAARDFAAAARAQKVDVQETMLMARGGVIPGIGVSPEVDRVAFSLAEGA